jgi:transcriptional regulator with XRE-family HTH domain
MYEAQGAELRALREATGLTIDELATQVGCEAEFLGHVETSERRASRHFVAHLAAVLAGVAS